MIRQDEHRQKAAGMFCRIAVDDDYITASNKQTETASVLGKDAIFSGAILSPSSLVQRRSEEAGPSAPGAST